MKIIELHAENVKRLKAVDITPASHVQIVGGRNAQGKTSVLDSIWLALGGGSAAKGTTRPIRDGEEAATIRLDLGEVVVTRSWKGDKTTLTVASADGAKFSGPQGVLDALVGKLSFDPLEFTRLAARDQVAALLDLVDLDVDLDKLSADRAKLYEDRTDVGRQGKALGDAPATIPGAPKEEVSALDLIAQIREVNAEDIAQRNDVTMLTSATSHIKELERQLEDAKEALKTREAAVKAHKPVPDVTALERELEQVDETNRAVRANATAREHAAKHKALTDQYASLTGQISALDKSKAKALAKAKFPIEGLGFDDNGVTYQDVPFTQASDAEQIRVSVAMAMSLNPKLRVIRILDGSLLDADNLALIENMAQENDYQVWIERVGNTDAAAIIIEDGEVAA